MNEPAFPRPASKAHHHGMHPPQEGMTLRDYFAAKAMQAFIDKYSHEGDISRHAYKVADAMMKARQQ